MSLKVIYLQITAAKQLRIVILGQRYILPRATMLHACSLSKYRRIYLLIDTVYYMPDRIIIYNHLCPIIISKIKSSCLMFANYVFVLICQLSTPSSGSRVSRSPLLTPVKTIQKDGFTSHRSPASIQISGSAADSSLVLFSFFQI